MVQRVSITFLRVCCIISLVYCSNNLFAQSVPFPVFCFNVDGSLINDDPSAGIANLDIIGNPGIFESGDPRAVDLYKAYKLYKKGDLGQTINVMEELGFKLDRTFKRRIEPNGQIDSLIFKIDEKATAIFHTIDLIYLKNVDATITIKTDQNIKLLVEFKDLLEKEGFKIKPIQCDKGFCYQFEENDEFWIVDKRWKEWTYTKWQSLYRHNISAHGDFLVVSLTETIPEEWVPRDKVPRDKVYR